MQQLEPCPHIGSTTVKIAILDEEHTIVFSDYKRHFANIRETLSDLLNDSYNKEMKIGLEILSSIPSRSLYAHFRGD